VTHWKRAFLGHFGQEEECLRVQSFSIEPKRGDRFTTYENSKGGGFEEETCRQKAMSGQFVGGPGRPNLLR